MFSGVGGFGTAGGQIQYGVCCSSFEWGSVAGDGGSVGAFDYLNQTQFAQLVTDCVNRKMKIIRLQCRQERLQGTLFATLGTNGGGPVNYWTNLKSYVKMANDKGIYVVISPHNFNQFYRADLSTLYTLGDANYSVAALGDFWYRMGLEFRHNPLVGFNLTNEPKFELSCTTLVGYWNTVISKIRESGFGGWIMAPSTGYCGAINWVSEGAGAAMKDLKDPCNRTMWEVHCYLNSDGSGGDANVPATSTGVSRMTNVINDARKYGFKVMVGETNYVESGTNATTAFTNMMVYLYDNRDIVHSVCLWSQGEFIYPAGGSQTLTPNASIWNSSSVDTVRLDPWKPYLGLP